MAVCYLLVASEWHLPLDIKKAKGTSDTTQSDHIERKIIPKNADPTRTHLNRVLVEYPDGVHGLSLIHISE